MRSSRRLVAAAVVCAIATLTGGASAHDDWLAPSIDERGRLELRMLLGDGMTVEEEKAGARAR